MAHVVSICLVSFLVYTAWPGSSLFSWHPTLMSVAFCFLLFEGLMAFNRQSSLVSHHDTKIQAHTILNAAAVVLACIGVYFIYCSKEEQKKPHLTSWHSWIGTFTVSYLLLQCLGGIISRYPMSAVRPADMRLYHATSGTFLFTMSCFAVASGLCSNWFTSQVGGFVWYICFLTTFLLGSFVCKQVTDHYLPIINRTVKETMKQN